MNDKSIETWLKGIPCEITFWKNIYSHKAYREYFLFKSKLNHEIELHNFDVKNFLVNSVIKGKQPLVIDLGCGMSYFTGNLIDGKPINIHYVDPLADFYNEILAKRTKGEAPKIEFGMMEHISSFYQKDEVSLIIIQNALDHSANPLKGIIESVRTLHIGGVLYLKHYPNEAEKEAYRGFHQFNINIENDSLIVWNRNKRFNINEFVKPYANVEVSTWDDPNEVIAVITKTDEMPATFIDDKNDIKELSHQLLLQAKLTNQFSFVVKYQIVKALYSLARPVAYHLNANTVSKIRQVFKSFRHSH